MPPEYERGYADGFSDGFDEGVFKVEQDLAMKEGYSTDRGMRYIQGRQRLPGRRRYSPRTSRRSVNRKKPRKARKLSSWQRYIKNKKNHIKLRSGKLNLKKMAVQFRKTKAGKKKK